jgi:hypothetical protein
MKKNKWDIIGQDIDKDNSKEYNDYFYYWYDGEEDYNFYDDDLYIYEYTDVIPYDEYVSKRGIRVNINVYQRGRFIDMDTIYPKEVLRQRKIDYLLGNEKYEIQHKPTILDIINYKKNERNRKNN